MLTAGSFCEGDAMRKVIVAIGSVGAIAGFVAWWRRHRTFGAAWVTRVVDPWLVGRGVVDRSNAEIGLLEHAGRTTGTVRICPVHPIRTADGFRVILPLGVDSQWARNVLAAGHCRLQLGDVVYELDEPVLVVPSAIDDLPAPVARVMDWLGFRYLVLRRFAERPGTLDVTEDTSERTPAAPLEAPLEAVTTG
jgi:hypothetical protein